MLDLGDDAERVVSAWLSRGGRVGIRLGRSGRPGLSPLARLGGAAYVASIFIGGAAMVVLSAAILIGGSIAVLVGWASVATGLLIVGLGTLPTAFLADCHRGGSDHINSAHRMDGREGI